MDNEKALSTLDWTLPTKRENSNVRRVLDDRLLLSEAIDAVTRMIRGYANKGQADRSYIGAIAEILAYYPKQVALACAHPLNGVSRETKFMPTPADVIAWCERRTSPLHEQAERERRVAEQLKARHEWESQEVSASLKAKGRAWLDRTDPAAQQLSGQKAKGQLTQEELDSIMADARAAGAGLAGMRLSAEALALIGSAKRMAAMDEEVT